MRIIGVQMEKTEKEKKGGPWENSWRGKSWEPPLNGEGNSSLNPNTPESLKQDAPKVKHFKTHFNQTLKI